MTIPDTDSAKVATIAAALHLAELGHEAGEDDPFLSYLERLVDAYHVVDALVGKGPGESRAVFDNIKKRRHSDG